MKQMRDFDSYVRREVAEVFVDGYKEKLGFLSKDYESLIEAFQKMINPNVFNLAMLNGEVA